MIREEKMMGAYDLLEIYCELSIARLSIIDTQKYVTLHPRMLIFLLFYRVHS